MTGYNSAIAWSILIPLALISILLASLAIGYYRSVSRSLDIFLLSFLFSLFLNVVLVVLIQALLFLMRGSGAGWSLQLCQFYSWVSFTSRLAGLCNITALAIDRVLILRKPGSYKYHASAAVKWAVVILWVFCAFLGAVPIAGWSRISVFTEDKRCLYLSYELDRSLGIFVIIITLASASVSILCLLDAFLHLRYLKTHNMFTVGAGESGISEIIAQGGRDRRPGASAPTCVDLAGAFDSCRFVCVVTAMYLMLNQLPYCALSLTGIIMHHSSDTYHVVALWFVILECLLIPHALWCCNTRYRIGFKHVPDVLLCRYVKPVDEGDGIHLSGYKSRENGNSETLYEIANGGLTVIDINARDVDESKGNMHNEQTRKIHHKRGLSLSLSDPLVKRPNGFTSPAIAQVHKLPRTLSLDSHILAAASDTNGSDNANPLVSSRNIQLNKNVIEDIATRESPSKKIPDRRQTRKKSSNKDSRASVVTSPSKSRAEWREAMRKKHLPHLFTDDAVQKSYAEYDNPGFQASIDLDDEHPEIPDTLHKETIQNDIEITQDVAPSVDEVDAERTRVEINISDRDEGETLVPVSPTLTNEELAKHNTRMQQLTLQHSKALSIASSQMSESDVTDAVPYEDGDIADILDSASISTTTGSVLVQKSVSVDDVQVDLGDINGTTDIHDVHLDVDNVNEATGMHDTSVRENDTIHEEVLTKTTDKHDGSDSEAHDRDMNVFLDLEDQAGENKLNGHDVSDVPANIAKLRDESISIFQNEHYTITPTTDNLTFSTFGKSLYDNGIPITPPSMGDDDLSSGYDENTLEQDVFNESNTISSIPNPQINKLVRQSSVLQEDPNKVSEMTFSTFGKSPSVDRNSDSTSNKTYSVMPERSDSSETDFSVSEIAISTESEHDNRSFNRTTYQETFTSFTSDDINFNTDIVSDVRDNPSRSSASPFNDDFSDVISTTHGNHGDEFDLIPDPGVIEMNSASPIQQIWGDEINENSDFQSFNDMSKFYDLDNRPFNTTLYDSRSNSSNDVIESDAQSAWCTFDDNLDKMDVPIINIQGATPPGTLTRTKPEDIWGPVNQANDNNTATLIDIDSANTDFGTNPFSVRNGSAFGESVSSEDNISEPELVKTSHPNVSKSHSVHARSNESTPVADREVDEIFSTSVQPNNVTRQEMTTEL